jgi:hypothetical protein
MPPSFGVGARVKLKVSNPPCCGFGDPGKYGEITGRGKDGVKWRVRFEGEAAPIDVREEDLTLVTKYETL